MITSILSLNTSLMDVSYLAQSITPLYVSSLAPFLSDCSLVFTTEENNHNGAMRNTYISTFLHLTSINQENPIEILFCFVFKEAAAKYVTLCVAINTNKTKILVRINSTTTAFNYRNYVIFSIFRLVYLLSGHYLKSNL